MKKKETGRNIKHFKNNTKQKKKIRRLQCYVARM